MGVAGWGEGAHGLGMRGVRVHGRPRELARDLSWKRVARVTHTCVYNRLQTCAEKTIMWNARGRARFFVVVKAPRNMF